MICRITMAEAVAKRFETLSRDTETASQTFTRIVNDEHRRLKRKATRRGKPSAEHASDAALELADKFRLQYFLQTGKTP